MRSETRFFRSAFELLRLFLERQRNFAVFWQKDFGNPVFEFALIYQKHFV
jgi:hypothetical protein